jgi:hypothetical protein
MLPIASWPTWRPVRQLYSRVPMVAPFHQVKILLNIPIGAT